MSLFIPSGRTAIQLKGTFPANHPAPTQASRHPELRIPFHEVKGDELICDNFYESVAKNNADRTLPKAFLRSIDGTPRLWTQKEGLHVVDSLGLRPSPIDNTSKRSHADLGTGKVDLILRLTPDSAVTLDGIDFCDNPAASDQRFTFALRCDTVGTRGVYLYKWTPVNNVVAVNTMLDATVVPGVTREIRVVRGADTVIHCYLRNLTTGLWEEKITRSGDAAYATNTWHGFTARRSILSFMRGYQAN